MSLEAELAWLRFVMQLLREDTIVDQLRGRHG
jgi:hypothetical protein